MSNLITDKQKKKIKIEYIIRLVSSCLLMASLLGLFLLAYVVPYYVSVSKKDIIVTNQFDSVINIENKENVGESISRIVNRTLAEMVAVERYGADNSITSDNINKIIESKNSAVRITRISFSLISKDQGRFIVNGVSENRDGLVSFIEDLKLAGFAKVESPISDFAKDSDVTFTISIDLKI